MNHRGHRVFATGRNETALAELKEEARGLALETVPLDVCDAESVEEARKAVHDATRGHGVDVLINNAGYGQAGAMIDLSDEQLRAQFGTNVFGLMAVPRAFVGPMLDRGKGRVLNVSSVAGHVTIPFFGAYHASRFAVRSLSDALRTELGTQGVEVVLIEPGPIETGFATTSIQQFQPLLGRESRFEALYSQVQAIEESIDVRSADVRVVVDGIVHAVESRRPRLRYVMPLSSRLLRALVVWVADPVLDAFWSTVLRVGGLLQAGRRAAAMA